MSSYGNQWFASAGSSGPTDLSQSDFEAAFTTRSGASTFTYDDDTYGNYLTLVSPGGNTFYRNNSHYSGGFGANTYIQWNIGGYGFSGFYIYEDGDATNNTHLETTGSVSYNVIYNTSVREFTGGNAYSTGGANSTSGNIMFHPFHGGTGGTAGQSLGSGFKYWGDSNPTFYRTGLDEDAYWYIEAYTAGGTTSPPDDGTGFTKSSRYYMVASTAGPTTDKTAAGIVNYGTNTFQFAWGNYDGGSVETMRRIVVRTPQ